MTSWDERAKGSESQYKRDQELTFKVTARRNKLLGLWVAEKLGKAGPDADAYAKTVIEADFEKPGDDDVIDKVLADLAQAGKPSTAGEIKARLEHYAAEARKQLTQG
jgi:hypothetical protein